MIVIIPMYYFWYIWYFLMNLTFVLYVPEDGHMFSRNMLELTVCIKLILVYMCAFLAPLFYVIGQCTERGVYQVYNYICSFTSAW
jgi:hypothetical protein